MRRPRLTASIVLGILVMAPLPALAGGHTWKISEVFSNSDGTIQFVEVREMAGTPGEVATAGHTVSSNTKVFTIPSNVVSPTSNRHLLIATPAFAALPGVPTPDYILPVGSVPFMSLTSDAIKYSGNDPVGLVYTAGQLPTDGVNSRNKNAAGILSTAVNSPTNYAGAAGSVDVSTPPPGVPSGLAGSTPMRASKLDVPGSSLSVTFDTSTCSGSGTRQIIYGQGSQLPSSPGGAFSLSGSACGIASSPFTWNSVPAPTGGTGLVWWLLTVKGPSNKEGSWGKNSAGVERVRVGPGDGSSGQCGVTSRNISNACGH